MTMKRLLLLVVICGILGVATFVIGGQNPPQQNRPQQATPNADPYHKNGAPGTTAFPLAPPAGKDSNAGRAAPAGAVNQGPFDPAKWKYGPAFDAPEGGKVWNPVKLKLMQGGKVTGGTLFSA